jgi:hypothetical protein
LGLERRQVYRLLKAYRIEGASGLISKRRGRRSNRRKPEALRRAVLTMIRQWYWSAGRALRYAGAPRPPAARPSDICKWQNRCHFYRVDT